MVDVRAWWNETAAVTDATGLRVAVVVNEKDRRVAIWLSDLDVGGLLNASDAEQLRDALTDAIELIAQIAAATALGLPVFMAGGTWHCDTSAATNNTNVPSGPDLDAPIPYQLREQGAALESCYDIVTCTCRTCTCSCAGCRARNP